MLNFWPNRGYFGNRIISFLVLTSILISTAAASENINVYSFQKPGGFRPVNQIDEIVLAALKEKGIRPANLCSDEVFIRRVYLDVLGTLPEVKDVRTFLENPRSDKRSTLINMVLQRPEYADYWSLKWCDILRVKSEFPINLWPNAVQAYHQWIRDSLSKNMPYDEFTRQLLTTSGSNFRYPQVNFYRAIQGTEPSSIANAAALNFMGVRLEKWPADKRQGLEAFFSRVAYKGTAEWKEEIVYLDPTPTEGLKTVLPDGTAVKIKAGQDPRKVFADWLIHEDNKWFARNIVNRVWAWLFGRGIIDPADDIGPHNEPVYPEVLGFLEKKLVDSDYDLKEVFRVILNSSVYQQSSIPKAGIKNPEAVFACYPVRQLDAEVLVDVICHITGTNESYSSMAPEPFTFVPASNRSIELADGSISSPLLEMFGRPSRDSGYESERKNETTDKQRLHFLNSTQIQSKIEKSWKLKRLINQNKRKPAQGIAEVYLNILSRNPNHEEIEIALDYFKKPGIGSQRGTVDLIWALINSKEFLYRH